MFASIRAKLGVVFLGFMLLVMGSVVATFVTVRAQAADALVINLAGRQRMLTQAMSKAALGIAGGRESGYGEELRHAATLFDLTLAALLDGGTAPYGDRTVVLPATTDRTIRDQLEVVNALWVQLRDTVDEVQVSESQSVTFAEAILDFESLSPAILEEMDRAVQLYEAAAQAKLDRLRLIQISFFVSAVGLVGTGYVLTQRTVVAPLADLERSAKRFAGGDLASPIQIISKSNVEVRTLGESLESMRQRLAASRRELESWSAELESRVAHRTAQLAALFELSNELSGTLEIARVLQLVADKTRDLAGGEVAVLCLVDPVDRGMTVSAISGSREGLVGHPQTLVKELEDSPAEADILHQAHECVLLAPAFRHSHLVVPLRLADRILGWLCVGHRDENCFGQEESRLLTLLASAGAVALENARSYEQAEQAAILAERKRFLVEIHDGLAQTLSFLDLRLDVVRELLEGQALSSVPEHLELLQRTVRQAGQEARRLMADLQASPAPHRSLDETLTDVIESFATEREMDVQIRVETGEPIWAPHKVCEQVTRIVIEALTNVWKHAPSSHVTFSLRRDGDQAVARVRDDGPGFDVSAPVGRGQHFGLKVMRVRAEQIDGKVSLESTPGQGTLVALRWPVAHGEGGNGDGITDQGTVG
jgi:two-component system nitrate/nitrite sensor histidine kinase NarX